MTAKRVDLEQGSSAWLEWRRGGVGSSDVSALFSLCPYKTRLELFREIVFGESKPVNTFITSLGHKFEPIARGVAEQKFGYSFEPACFEDGKHPFVRASLDGYNSEHHHLIEIKYVGQDKLKALRKSSTIDPSHIIQMTYQAAILDGFVTSRRLPRVSYVAYTLNSSKTEIDDIVILDAPIDFAHQNGLPGVTSVISEVTNFWTEHVEKQTPPLLDVKKDDFEDSSENAKEISAIYQSLMIAKDQIDVSIDQIKQKIFAMTNDFEKASIGSLMVTTSERAGSIDYKKVLKDNGLSDIDLSPYRKESSTFRRISIKAKGDNGESVE